MNWGDIPAWVGIVVAFGVGLYAAIVARGARRATEAQADEMRRANSIAEEANRIANEALAHARETALGEIVWDLAHDSGDIYLLSNIGTAAAYEVELQYDGYLEEAPPVTIKPGARLRFLALAQSAGVDRTIRVLYAVQPGEPKQIWTAPKPPKR